MGGSGGAPSGRSAIDWTKGGPRLTELLAGRLRRASGWNDEPTGGGRQASKPPNDRQTPRRVASCQPHWLQSEAARTPIGQGAGNRRRNANWASGPTLLERSNEERPASSRAPAKLTTVGPREPRLGRLLLENCRTNPPLAGEAFDELHGLVDYFAVTFAYAFGYARFQVVA